MKLCWRSMWYLMLLVCLGCVHSLPDGGQIKAVLVAGSRGYDNYRHQADVCHAYHVLLGNGIPRENIIVMMYDDIANNSKNPLPGVIINFPNGPNVYEGVQIDYSGEEVSKKNFFHILKGNKLAMNGIGSSRVLESGPADHIFLNFVDHGGPGEFSMPKEDIPASEFISVLQYMYNNSRFAKMFLYIEACQSGSMFDDLLGDNLNIFVMTAAAPRESSYACYYDEKLETYLADVFSLNWMNDAETSNLKTESVNHQFQKVRHSTTTSHVQEYGDIDIGTTPVSEVLGGKRMIGYADIEPYTLDFSDAVPSTHVPVAILGQKIMRAKSPEEKEKLESELHHMLEARKKIDQVFTSLQKEVVSSSVVPYALYDMESKDHSLTKTNIKCYEKVKKHVSKRCFSIINNPFVVNHLNKIIDMCNVAQESLVMDKIASVCDRRFQFEGVV